MIGVVTPRIGWFRDLPRKQTVIVTENLAQFVTPTVVKTELISSVILTSTPTVPWTPLDVPCIDGQCFSYPLTE